MNDKKVFDDYSQLCECLQCNHYYNDQCDGIKVVDDNGSNTQCKAFSATRRVIIPQDINDLKNTVKSLNKQQFLFGALLVAHILTEFLANILGW